MAMFEIEYDARDVEAALELIERNAKRKLRGLIEGAGTYSTYWLRLYAPIGETAYILRHIDQTQSRWRPGGVGGGGQWEVISGVRTGTSRHPLYVHQATGIYATPSRGLIKPNIPITVETAAGKKGGVMTFQKRGEPRKFKRWVRGQTAQPFAYHAFQQTRLYVGARTLMFGRELLTP